MIPILMLILICSSSLSAMHSPAADPQKELFSQNVTNALKKKDAPQLEIYLCQAISHGNHAIVSQIVSAQIVELNPPACEKKAVPLVTATIMKPSDDQMIQNQKQIIQTLLTHGAHPDHTNKEGFSALSTAEFLKNQKLIDLYKQKVTKNGYHK